MLSSSANHPSAPEEIVLYTRAFAPEMIPANALVRCGNCGLMDSFRVGHSPSDCNVALRDEVARLNAQIAGLSNPGWGAPLGSN